MSDDCVTESTTEGISPAANQNVDSTFALIHKDQVTGLIMQRTATGVALQHQ